MNIITTRRLILRTFERGDESDVKEFLSQLRSDPFGGYPDVDENFSAYFFERFFLGRILSDMLKVKRKDHRQADKIKTFYECNKPTVFKNIRLQKTI